MTVAAITNAVLVGDDIRRAAGVYPTQCWWNALRVGALIRRRRRAAVVRYVEGFAIMPKCGIPFEHGWLSVDGATVEPTLDAVCPSYFPAREYEIPEAKQLERAHRKRGMPLTGWPVMLDRAAWQEANIAVHAAAFGQSTDTIRAFFGGVMSGGGPQ